jgi:hypothetical protein
MNNQFDTPILMLVFNRPSETQQVFDEVAKIRPSKLYIAADGPRKDRPNDLALTEKTRAVFSQINWPCEVKYLFRENNLSCGPAVSSAIDWFFEQEEMGIILEDDCLPDPSFFTFCHTLLLHHQHDDQIMHISGSNFQRGNTRGEASYYYSMFSSVWGWATWRRAWKNHYDFTLTRIDPKTIQWNTYTSNRGIINYWKRAILLVKMGIVNTWDYQWSISVYFAGGLCIIPNQNLITNIGYAPNSTHGKDNDSFWTVNQPSESMKQIVLNDDVKINREADNFYYKEAINATESFIQKIVKELKFLKVKFSNRFLSS